MESTEQEIMQQHFANICIVVEKYIGTKQEHIALELALNAIKEKLFTNGK